MQAVAAAGAGPRKPALRVRFARAAAPYLLILPGGGWLFLFVLLPFFVSFVIRTLSWETLLADYGPLFKPLKDVGLLPEDFRVLATPVAVTGGLAYTFFPFMMLPIFASLEKIDRRLVEAAEDL